MKRKNAFTLVELLVVMAIIVTLATIMIGTFNAIGITNRGRDAQRKKDINRIKVAFEEYFSDKGIFPDSVLVEKLMDKSNCGSDVFSPYLSSWPCDPNGNPYLTFAENGNRFRIITNLENEKDKDIPLGWYEREDFLLMGKTKEDVNYGVSSSNILWYEQLPVDPSCNINSCDQLVNGNCVDGASSCSGSDGNCYYTGSFCGSLCKVPPGYFCPR
ncbi:MAG: type II secretion system protein [Candidatus Shapirobacteria bacterium]|nr:type II secretion system protein [Candidatus Shapirobacteria bacterium]